LRGARGLQGGLDDADPGQLETLRAARVEGGMRTSDLHRWDWSMIDRVNFAECKILRSKTKQIQTLELHPVVAETLRLHWIAAGRHDAGPVFPVRRGVRAGQQKAMRGNSYAKRLRRALLRCSVIRHVCTRPADADPRKGDEPCCANLAHDPLFSETATTLPVDFHSFRRAFSSAMAAAGVNAQRAMRLASHADEKTHMRYVMNTPEMRLLPPGAVPNLPTTVLQLQQPATFAATGTDGNSMISARPAGLEPATSDLEGRCSIQLSYGRMR
jgi:integrase